MRKNILVTGGCGFIGSHLVERLLADGHDVSVIDDLRSAVIDPDTLYQRQEKRHTLQWQIESIQDSDLFSWVSPCFDEIYHLASPVGAVGILAYGGDIVREVVRDTYKIADYARRIRARMLNVSTSEIYGGGDHGLCAENMPRLIQAETTIRLEYAIAKLAAETALLNLQRTKGLDVVIVRPFNVAGARQSSKGGFVVPRFVEQVLRGEPLTVFGDGSQQRAFTHVTDIVDGLVRAMERAKNGAVYNLGNPNNRTTINDLAARTIEQAGQGTIQYVDPKTIYGDLYADAPDKFPDSAKAMRELDWKPIRTIPDILNDVIAYTEAGDYADIRS